MRSNRGWHCIIALVFALTACQPPSLNLPPPAETVLLHIQSTTATAPLLRDLADSYQAAYPHLRFAFRLPTGSYSTLLGSLTTHTPQMPPYGLTHYLAPTASLWATPIALDQIGIITHPDNPVSSLTLAQLRAIYDGRIINWAAVGGPNRPIVVVSREAESGARQAFETLVMRGTPITRQARLAPNPNALNQIVQDTPGAIGYASLHTITPSARLLALDGIQPTNTAVTGYALTTPIYLVGQTPPDKQYHTFFAWLQTPAGQQTLARHYLPLPADNSD